MTLLEIQRQMAADVMKPASGGSNSARFLKPNSRLSSLGRLEIYRRSYWARLLDSLREDFPGLAAILGSASFERLATAYLAERPSSSFTLRDLGAHLEEWLGRHPRLAGTSFAAALDMVRLEWAHVVAFDAPAEETLGPEDLAGLGPAMRLSLQPYITLLELRHAVDEFRVALQKNREGTFTGGGIALEKISSDDKTRLQEARTQIPAKQPQPGPIFLAVHRIDTVVYYRRLQREEFLLLKALQSGQRLNAAIRLAFVDSPSAQPEVPTLLGNWFSTWAQFAWLTARPRKGRRL